MAKKSNLKSVRISNEVMDYIINFEGDGFNQKFENLVLFCMKEEDSKRQTIRHLDEKIQKRRELLDRLWKLETGITDASRQFSFIQGRLRAYAEYIDALGDML